MLGSVASAATAAAGPSARSKSRSCEIARRLWLTRIRDLFAQFAREPLLGLPNASPLRPKGSAPDLGADDVLTRFLAPAVSRLRFAWSEKRQVQLDHANTQRS